MSSLDEDPNYAPTLHPQREPGLIGLCIAFIILSGLVTACRFWSRATISGKKFDADDWIALASWPMAVAVNVCAMIWLRSGLGLHQKDVPLGDIIKGLKVLYAGYIFYNVAMTLIRSSVVLFYRRTFVTVAGERNKFVYFIWFTMALNIVWFLVVESYTAFRCKPIAASWDPTINNAKCLSTLSTQLASGITSILLDLWILLLPMPKILKLHMQLRRKFLSVVIFFLGYCVIILTIGRIVSITKEGTALNNDLDWAFVVEINWLLTEVSIASISISLPSLLHLVRRARQSGFMSLFNDHEDFTCPANSRPFTKQQRRLSGYNESAFSRLKDPPNCSKEREIEFDSLVRNSHLGEINVSGNDGGRC